jgi:2-polyprenyl-3-methyl-5-hydroxy-6-metoxy-1,4-benzoquinol methylase
MSQRRIKPVNDRSEQQITVEHFDQVVDFWHKVYNQEDTFVGYSLIKQHNFTVDYIKGQLSAGAAVLDVGCGTGITLLELARHGYHVSGVDLSPKMIEKAQDLAQTQGLTCDFRVASVEQLPYPDQSFDMVIALGLLGVLPDHDVSWAEIRRVLRPQGQFLVSVPNVLGLDRWIGIPRSIPLILGHDFRVRYRRGSNVVRRLLGFPTRDKPVRFGYSALPSRYRSRLGKYGFTEVRYQSLTFGPMFPLGLNIVPDAAGIRFSERLCTYRLMNSFGNIVVFYGKK